MAGRSVASRVAVGVVALVLGCAAPGGAAEKATRDASGKSTWRDVKRRVAMARKAGDRKAFENQLTRLSPDDLFLCSQQFCDALPSGAEERGDHLPGVYAVGFMLHLHQKKVGLEATLRAIGSALGTTDNELWAESSLEWLRSLKRRKIPPAGIHAIAEGALQALPADGGKDRLKVQQALLAQVSSKWILFVPRDRARLRTRLQELSANAKNTELRKAAASAVQCFDRNQAEYERELEQCKDPKEKAELRRRLYGPQQPQKGQPAHEGNDER